MGTGLVILGAYLAFGTASYSCFKYIDKAYDAKLKRLGLISTKPDLYDTEKNLVNIASTLKVYLCMLIPIINLIPFFMLFDFENLTDGLINDAKREGKLREIKPEELKGNDQDKDYLRKRIEEVKKFQEQMGHKNIPRSYRELNNREKLALLLHELETVYKDLAEEEGIDLDELPALLGGSSDDDASKKLRKTP